LKVGCLGCASSKGFFVLSVVVCGGRGKDAKKGSTSMIGMLVGAAAIVGMFIGDTFIGEMLIGATFALNPDCTKGSIVVLYEAGADAKGLRPDGDAKDDDGYISLPNPPATVGKGDTFIVLVDACVDIPAVESSLIGVTWVKNGFLEFTGTFWTGLTKLLSVPETLVLLVKRLSNCGIDPTVVVGANVVTGANVGVYDDDSVASIVVILGILLCTSLDDVVDDDVGHDESLLGICDMKGALLSFTGVVWLLYWGKLSNPSGETAGNELNSSDIIIMVLVVVVSGTSENESKSSASVLVLWRVSTFCDIEVKS